MIREAASATLACAILGTAALALSYSGQPRPLSSRLVALACLAGGSAIAGFLGWLLHALVRPERPLEAVSSGALIGSGLGFVAIFFGYVLLGVAALGASLKQGWSLGYQFALGVSADSWPVILLVGAAVGALLSGWAARRGPVETA